MLSLFWCEVELVGSGSGHGDQQVPGPEVVLLLVGGHLREFLPGLGANLLEMLVDNLPLPHLMLHLLRGHGRPLMPHLLHLLLLLLPLLLLLWVLKLLLGLLLLVPLLLLLLLLWLLTPLLVHLLGPLSRRHIGPTLLLHIGMLWLLLWNWLQRQRHLLHHLSRWPDHSDASGSGLVLLDNLDLPTRCPRCSSRCPRLLTRWQTRGTDWEHLSWVDGHWGLGQLDQPTLIGLGLTLLRCLLLSHCALLHNLWLVLRRVGKGCLGRTPGSGDNCGCWHTLLL